MTHIRRIFTLVITLIVFSSLSTSIAFAQDPDNGKVLWEEQIWQCSRCHGPMGEGLFAGPRAGDELTAQDWINQVRSPKRAMPHFSPEQVSDEQIIDMHAYLTSLPKPAGEFKPKEVALPPDSPEGQMLIVQKRCVACHGETGPVNRFVDRGEMPTAEAVIKQLRTPFKNMPSFSVDQVSDAEASLIADFLAQEFAAQAAPGTLPQSGGTKAATPPVSWLLIGGGLLVTGFILRRLAARA
jgi:ubiquinol-cytochrome c reductase cytochrome c subunit